jgi:phosphoribosylaminoimidazole carboxylase
MHQAEIIIQPVIDFVGDIYVQGINTPSQSLNPKTLIASSKPLLTIGVVMGSDSALKTLIPGLKLLKYYFGIEPDVSITSAHRTPTYGRGCCIFTWHGGYTYLTPCYRITSERGGLDGGDSLYSIVQIDGRNR